MGNHAYFQLISREGEDGIEQLLTLLDDEKKKFEIGDTLHIKGRLSFYKEEWKLFANFARIVLFIIDSLALITILISQINRFDRV